MMRSIPIDLPRQWQRHAIVVLSLMALLLLSACSSSPKHTTSSSTRSNNTGVFSPTESASTPKANPSSVSNPNRGGYYQDDGPGENIPPNLESTPDPIPAVEPFSRTGNKPYQVFGKTYTPLNDTTTPFKQRGIASWYGKKFHGKRTSSGEPYDMFKITAAHPILPIPSYARVTNLSNGKQIIVRINDRGPFHSNRVMDLSYTAALKLGYLGKGSSEIEIERLLPDEIARMAENRKNQITQTEQSADDNALAARSALDRERQLELRDGKKKTADTKPMMIVDRSSETIENSPKKTETEPGSAFYLQFAAFGLKANAEASREQMMRKVGDQFSSLNMAMEIIEQGNLYRLQAGPFSSRAEAQMMLDKVMATTGKAIIVQR